MKKIFCILSILTIIAPVAVNATPVAGSPTSYGANQPTGENKTAVLGDSPLYQLIAANGQTDGNAASAGYVKGAYNASIKAVNKVADSKQDTLTSSNVTTSGTGAVVTAVSASNGAVTVTKSNVQIPVGSSSATTYANIWVQ